MGWPGVAGDMRRLFRTAQHIDPHIGNPCVLTFMAVACPGRHIAPAIRENYSSPAAVRHTSKLRLAGCI